MNSLPPRTDAGTESPPTVHFAAEAGLPYRPERIGDPIQAWLELMEVVEALCPRWPERERSSYADCRL